MTEIEVIIGKELLKVTQKNWDNFLLFTGDFVFVLNKFRGPTYNFRLVKSQSIDNMKIISYHSCIQYGHII